MVVIGPFVVASLPASFFFLLSICARVHPSAPALHNCTWLAVAAAWEKGERERETEQTERDEDDYIPAAISVPEVIIFVS